MDKKYVKETALANGFKLKNQSVTGINWDLNPYVYDFADAICSQLEQERDQLKAQNASFTEAIQSAADIFKRLDEQGAHIIGEEDVFLSLHLLYEKLIIINSADCLAEIQAKAIEEAVNKCATRWGGPKGELEIDPTDLREHANLLRQQSKTISE